MHSRTVALARAAALEPPGGGIVFAGGCPRSGLTLLRRRLAQHPSILAGSDTGIAPSIAFQWRNFAASLGSLHRDFFSLDPAGVSAIMGRYLAGALRAPGEERIIVEKTSLNIVAFELLAHIAPGARFIHVVRDGRDVAASLMDRDWRDPENGLPLPYVSDPIRAIEYWAALAAVGLTAEKNLGPERVFRISYEDLASKPDRFLRRLYKFIDAPEPPEGASGAQLGDDDYCGMERDSLPLLLEPITASRIGRHKRDFSPAVISSMNERAGTALAALGYLT